jgi:hypothetical protein
MKRKRKPGKPNQLAEPLEAPEGTGWGPCMAALRSDRHRAFVLALYQVKPGYGANVAAAKMAGFGTSTTTAKGWSVIGSLLAHDEKIQAAMYEEDQKRIRASAPRAVRALSNLVEDPTHKEHAPGNRHGAGPRASGGNPAPSRSPPYRRSRPGSY